MFGLFWDGFWWPVGVNVGTRLVQTLEAWWCPARNDFGVHVDANVGLHVGIMLGAILRQFWNYCWVTIGLHFGTILEPMLGHFWDPCWTHFGFHSGTMLGPIAGPFLGPFEIICVGDELVYIF